MSGDVKSAVDAVREKRGGPREDSPGTPDDAQERKRARWREDKRKSRAGRGRKKEPEREPYVPDPASIKACGLLGSTLWDLLRMFTERRALTEAERDALGAALDPLFAKYVPALNEYAEEINFAMVCLTIWQATTPEEPSDDASPERPESSASVIE